MKSTTHQNQNVGIGKTGSLSIKYDSKLRYKKSGVVILNDRNLSFTWSMTIENENVEVNTDMRRLTTGIHYEKCVVVRTS